MLLARWLKTLTKNCSIWELKPVPSMRVELSNLSASGTVSFKIEGDNRTPIEILTNVVPNDLTNLVTAINDQSSRTGITAALSTIKSELFWKKVMEKIFSFLIICRLHLS